MHLNPIYIVIDNTTVTTSTQSCHVVYFHVSCYLYLYYICETTPLPIPLHDTRQGFLNVQRSRPHRFSNAALPPLSRLDHRRNPLCICCLPCSCPCPAPRVYVGAHVTPPEGGSPVGGHGDVFIGGSPWTVTGHLLDLP